MYFPRKKKKKKKLTTVLNTLIFRPENHFLIECIMSDTHMKSCCKTGDKWKQKVL